MNEVQETAMKVIQFSKPSKMTSERKRLFCNKSGHMRNKCVVYKKMLKNAKRSGDSQSKQKANVVAIADSNEYLFMTSSL